MNGPKGYAKLKRKLAAAGWSIHGELLSWNGIRAKPGWFAVCRYCSSPNRSVYFRTMRQLQKWVDSGFKSALPLVELEDGSKVKQAEVA